MSIKCSKNYIVFQAKFVDNLSECYNKIERKFQIFWRLDNFLQTKRYSLRDAEKIAHKQTHDDKYGAKKQFNRRYKSFFAQNEFSTKELNAVVVAVQHFVVVQHSCCCSYC